MAKIGAVTIDLVGVMPHCKDCRFWNRQHPWLSDGANVGICDRSGSDDGKPIDATSLVHAEDRGDGQAVLVTSPDFGCVQFRPKYGAL